MIRFAALLPVLFLACSPYLQSSETDPATSLRQAAGDGDLEMVIRLLENGVDVDAASRSGATALMYAAYGDHARVVEELLKAGAAPDLGDRHGDPATHWAAYGGAASAVETLLRGGADPTIVTHHGDALAIAMRRGFPEIVAILVDHTDTGTEDTPLHAAARQNDGAALNALLAAEVEVDPENRIGYTPLMEAAREGHVEIVARLRDAGADPAHKGNSLGMGMSALHLAADRDQRATTAMLLSFGVPVDVGNAQGTTALAWALGEGSFEAAETLLAAGADPALEDENGFSALDMAEYLKDQDLRNRLLSATGQ